MTANLIKEVRERLAKATPGPWRAAEGGPWGGQGFVVATNGVDEMSDVKRWFHNDPTDDSTESGSNAILMASAPDDLKKLCDIVDALRFGLERIREMDFNTKGTWANEALEKADALAKGEG